MKVLAPLTTQPPSTFSARVRIAATSEPVSGSVIASAAIFSPRIAGASQRSCCAAVPNVASGGVAIPLCAPIPAASPPEPERASSSASTASATQSASAPYLRPSQPRAASFANTSLGKNRAASHSGACGRNSVSTNARISARSASWRSVNGGTGFTAACAASRTRRAAPCAGAAAPGGSAGSRRRPAGRRRRGRALARLLRDRHVLHRGLRQRRGLRQPLLEQLARARVVEPLAVARVQRRRLGGAVDVGRRAHARGRRRQPRVDDRGRDAAVRQHGHRRLADPHLGQQLLEVVEVRLRIRRDRRLQRLGVVGRERAQRVLDARAELAEHLAREVLRVLGDEEDADALGADQAHGLRDRVEERVGGVVEEQVRLVEEEHELGLVEVAGLRQVLEQLGEQPHQRGREQRRLVLHARQLEAGDHAAAVRRRAQQVGDRELRLAEELVAAALLEPDQRAQQHADGGGGEAADALELRLALVGVEEGQQRAQVGRGRRAAGRSRRRSGRRA